MADTYIQACFVFSCTAAEWSLLQEAFTLSLDLCAELTPEPRSAAFMALFPASGSDPWAGFSALFGGSSLPDFGCDLAGGAEMEGTRWQAIISAETSFEPDAVAQLIQRCCNETLAQGPIGFEWSVSCSRQRIDEFGGGWCAVFADRIVLRWTRDQLRSAMAEASS
ncbi:hypothetical protein M9978_17175 [Sphingomonas sp. MG17]|uniref:Uncharacterized protein n=1 Tax=Sphingomonas tagetis TaxID=2949092 RepID=A0A9X2HM48_9SPHN|nr:hypothetical protein [Sphingomonas tagetis]MCP3732157.1 hypothetical protein [Sphingomonas tagetis]